MLESAKVYSLLIDPLLSGLRKKVALEIEKGETVIDIACGTGLQLIELADKAATVTGVDLSESMVSFATKSAVKRNITNASFHIADATDLSLFNGHNFDVAVLSMALHQFDSKLHDPILNEIKKVAGKIIILDYAIPLPKNYAGVASKVAEFLAGKEHYRNFKSYTKTGGLKNILSPNEFTIRKSKVVGKGAFHLMVVENHKG